MPEKKDQPKEAFFDFFVSKRGREGGRFLLRTFEKKRTSIYQRERDPLKTIP